MKGYSDWQFIQEHDNILSEAVAALPSNLRKAVEEIFTSFRKNLASSGLSPKHIYDSPSVTQIKDEMSIILADLLKYRAGFDPRNIRLPQYPYAVGSPNDLIEYFLWLFKNGIKPDNLKKLEVPDEVMKVINKFYRLKDPQQVRWLQQTIDGAINQLKYWSNRNQEEERQRRGQEAERQQVQQRVDRKREKRRLSRQRRRERIAQARATPDLDNDTDFDGH